jgi:lysophospholipase L1-like esterase
MTSVPGPTRSEFFDDTLPDKSAERWADPPAVADPALSAGLADWGGEKPSVIGPSSSAKTRVAVLKRKPPSLRRRAARSLIIFCVGIAAALGWQSYGDAARDVIANSYPQLGWLAPQTAAAATAPEMISPTTRASSSDAQEIKSSREIKSLLINLAAVRQSVDQLAAQFVASQQQIASDIAKLKATEQDIFDKISSAPPPRPGVAPARKPVLVPQSAQESPAR